MIQLVYIISKDHNSDSVHRYVIWTDEHIVSHCSHLDGDGLQQIKVCIKIGLEYVEIDRQKRPSIEEIVDRLNGLWSTGS